MLTVCVLYSQMSMRLQVSGSAVARVDAVVPIAIDSTNLWGIKIDLLEVTAFYAGNHDVALSRGTLEGFALVANGNSTFNISLSPAELGAAAAANALDYFAARCGVAWNAGTWLADIRVIAKVWGKQLTLWLYDVEVPCANAASVVPLAVAALPGNCDEQAVGRYCKRLLCAIDDLMCEKECAERPSPTAPPTTPPSPVLPAITPPVVLLSPVASTVATSPSAPPATPNSPPSQPTLASPPPAAPLPLAIPVIG